MTEIYSPNTFHGLVVNESLIHAVILKKKSLYNENCVSLMK